MNIDPPRSLGGCYSETAAVRHALDCLGATAAHSGAPLSEAMLFGVSGGVGGAYFVFEYQGQPPSVYVGVAHRYKTPFGEIMDGLYLRLGLRTAVKKTASQAVAAKHLEKMLAQGKPVILHLDMGKLPYYALRRQYMDHALMVYGVDAGRGVAHVADRASQPIALALDDLSQARASINSLKNRALTIEPPEAPIDLRQPIVEGIRACCQAMLHPPKPVNNFGLNAWRKWAVMVNRHNAPKSWPRLFDSGPALYQGLRSVFSFIELVQSNRGALRGLYADFLEEAAVVPDLPEFGLPAALFRKAAQAWSETGDALLPDAVPLFCETRRLLRRKEALFLEKGAQALPEMEAVNRRLFEIEAAVNESFPLDEAGVTALLDGLHDRLNYLCHCDSDAIDALRAVMREAGLAAPAGVQGQTR